jgi:hypothetical protein
MKNKLLLILTFALIIIGTGLCMYDAKADTGDVQIPLKIPAYLVPEFREYFFVYLPIAKENVYDPSNPSEVIGTRPKYSEKRWVQMKIKAYLLRCVDKGKAKKAQQMQTVTDPNMIQFDDNDPNIVE